MYTLEDLCSQATAYVNPWKCRLPSRWIRPAFDEQGLLFPSPTIAMALLFLLPSTNTGLTRKLTNR